ncbi:protein-lysine N-methyltransferase EEF2KMT isoform 1-T1 [Synchiropus picturatus]
MCRMDPCVQKQVAETKSKEENLKLFRNLFFASGRLDSFPWTFLENELERSRSPEVISDILKETLGHSLARQFPPSVKFRRKFVVELIKREEGAASGGAEPLDQLYDVLAQVIGLEERAGGYKSYFLPDGGAVSLLENEAMISDGTTGLVTWEAALYLAEWAMEHPERFSGRALLELGSGAGLTGIVVCRSCRPSRFIFSDCHPGVLTRLEENATLNGLMDRTDLDVRVQRLDWIEVTEEQLREVGADTVIAADVVYDPDVVEQLVRLLSMILRCSSVPPQVFICCTVRNPDTYGHFTRQLESAGIRHHVIDGPVNQVFPYNRNSPMQLIQLVT